MKYALIAYTIGESYHYLKGFDSFKEAWEELQRLHRVAPALDLDIITWD